MYKKVLVPLDGSELAECALPHVMNLAKGGMVEEVTLLKVIEIPLLHAIEGQRVIDAEGVKKSLLNEAHKYITDLRDKLSSEGLQVKTETIEGRAADSIINYSKENSIDLIVIATHGYSGMKKLMFGSAALRILHDAHAPILMIRPESCR